MGEVRSSALDAVRRPSQKMIILAPFLRKGIESPGQADQASRRNPSTFSQPRWGVESCPPFWRTGWGRCTAAFHLFAELQLLQQSTIWDPRVESTGQRAWRTTECTT